MIKTLAITISGFVQGVGFRYHTMNKAIELGVNGFVENLPDGKVYIEVEGEESVLKLFIDWCHSGPKRALVESVDIMAIEKKNFSRFSVERS